MDWAAFVPPAIPDTENFFEAPGVKEWFTKPGTNDLTERISTETAKLVAGLSNAALAHISVLSPSTAVPTGAADLVLRYVSTGKALFLQEPDRDHGTNTAETPEHANTRVLSSSWTGREIIPLIIFDDVPFPDAVKNLARQGGFTCVLHPELFRPKSEAEDPPVLPAISMRFQDVTAEQALVAVLHQHGFELVSGKTNSAHVVRFKEPDASEIVASDNTRRAIERTLSQGIGRATGGTRGGILLAEGLQQIKPIRIVLQTETLPNTDDLRRMFPGLMPGVASLSAVWLSPKLAGDGYNLCFAEPPVAAEEYLKWSNRFAPETDALREALKRPGARLPGEYRDPADMPRLNFVAVRLLAQMIAQRAKAHLVLNKPEAALEELTLLHDLRRPLQTKPVTLISAMVTVAVTGMYEDVVGDGLSLRAWREPQLMRLQQQLRGINLPPLVAEGLELERGFTLHTIALPPDQLALRAHMKPKTNFWEQCANPTLLAARFAPRGWVKDSMVLAAQLHQTSIDTYDPVHRLIIPSKSEEMARSTEQLLHHWSPRTCLAALAVPNFTRAWSSAARSEDIAKEALIACALERYRLSKGGLPNKLEELVPQFLDSIPQDVIVGSCFRYAPLENDRFLLYSPGWNQVDDGGEFTPIAYGPMDFSQGDWAWRPGQG